MGPAPKRRAVARPAPMSALYYPLIVQNYSPLTLVLEPPVLDFSLPKSQRDEKSATKPND